MEDLHSQHASFTLQQNPPLMDAITFSDSPTHLYGLLGKKKLQSALKMQRPITDDQLTNGFTSYSPHTPDASGHIIPRHQFCLSSL